MDKQRPFDIHGILIIKNTKLAMKMKSTFKIGHINRLATYWIYCAPGYIWSYRRTCCIAQHGTYIAKHKWIMSQPCRSINLTF